MKLLLQILLFAFTWFTNLNAKSVYAKIVLPTNVFTFSKIDNIKKESAVKIGAKNYARSNVEENHFQKQLFTFPVNTTILSINNESGNAVALNPALPNL